MKEKSLKINALLNITKTIMSLIFPLITFPYVSRIILAEGTGKVNFANSIISYFSIIATLGISTYGIREGAKLREDKQKFSVFVKELLSINLISTLIAYLLFVAALFLVPRFQEYKLLLVIVSSTLILTTLGIDWVYGALEEYKYITIRSVIFQIISLVLLFTFVKTKEDYVKYAGISVFSSAGSNICNLIHARRFIDFKVKEKLNLKKHLKPVLILFASTIAVSFFTILDTSMLGFLSNDTQVGYYSAASKIVRMVRDLFPAVFTVLFARLSIYASSNDESKTTVLLQKTIIFTICLSLPCIMGLEILMPQIISLLCGKDFYAAINSARVMAPLILLSSISGFLGGQFMLSLGKEKTYLKCMIAAALCDFILNFFLIPQYGAYGASIATLITEVIIFLVYNIILRQYIKKIKIIKQLLQFIAAALVMSLAVYFVQKYISNLLLNLMLSIITGIITYGLVLILCKNDFITSILKSVKDKIIKNR